MVVDRDLRWNQHIAQLSGKNDPFTNVYINEHLTPFNKNLLYNAKKLREHGWKYTREGKIFVEKNEGDRAIRITSLDQVNGLLNVNSKETASYTTLCDSSRNYIILNFHAK
ncbi:hypothetical protein J6590_092103 [Homalodisca vitripennis]|nr:hypothetical protein J6590_092103 [Homalodisca vitripennis]